MYKDHSALVVVVIIAFALIVSFFATAGLAWVVCWAFGFNWSWKLSIGVWALIFLISSAVKTTVRK